MKIKTSNFITGIDLALANFTKRYNVSSWFVKAEKATIHGRDGIKVFVTDAPFDFMDYLNTGYMGYPVEISCSRSRGKIRW